MSASADEIPAEEQREHRDLAEVFAAQGFDRTWAELLAAAHARPSATQRMLLDGCSHELVVAILV